MNKLLMALRTRAPQFTNSINTQQCLVTQTRGPKKKKGAAKTEAPENSDIVNIFKDKPDVVIYPTERYPPWLLKMLDETYTPDDVVTQIYRGERLPDVKEQWTLAKSFRRTFLTDQNKLIKDDWEYESEDDEGEDLGQLGQDETEGQIEGVEGVSETSDQSK